MSERVQYVLQAWSEGYYAHSCGQEKDKCPYEHDTPMALAWLKGWRDQGALTPPLEPQD